MNYLMNHLKKKTGLAAAMLVLTAMTAGCGQPQDTHDYKAEIAQVTKDQTINPHERATRIAELEDKLADQNTDRYLAQQQQQQWFPSEIIIGFGLFLLAGGLTFRRLQNPPLTGAAPGSKEKPGAKGASAKTPAKPGDIRGSGKQAPAPVPVSRAAPWDAPAAPVKVLETGQEAVDAIPEEQRGVSFFTSRPLSLDHLVETTFAVGGRDVTVWATQEEADAVASGRMPRIRALSMEGETRPWYAWHAYDPYRGYWPAETSGWVWRGGVVIASWLAIDRVDPSLAGYLSPLPDEGSFSDAASETGEEAPPQLLRKTGMILNAQDKPSFTPQKIRASVRPAAVAVSTAPKETAALAEDQASKPPSKTGLRHLWIYQVECPPKKAGRAALQSLD